RRFNMPVSGSLKIFFGRLNRLLTVFILLAVFLSSLPVQAQKRGPSVPPPGKKHEVAVPAPNATSVPSGRYIRANGASSDSPVKVIVGNPTAMVINCYGKSYKVKARTTGVEDEYLMEAADPQWNKIAKEFNGTFSYDGSGKFIKVTKSGKTHLLKMGQKSLPDAAGGREMDVPPQMVGSIPCFPISCLEDFFDVRVTISQNGSTGWVEPLISSVRLEGASNNPKLAVRSTGPVTFKTFRLSKPDRYVIDFSGGVLDTASMRVHHNEIGDIRLGQFTLGPAVTRVVVPVTQGMKITAPLIKTNTESVFAIEIPKTSVSKPASGYGTQKLVSYNVKEDSDKAYKCELQFSGPVQYSWKRTVAPDNRFILDLTNVVLVGKRREYKYNDEFVKSLRISQFQTEPVPITRIVAELTSRGRLKVMSGSTPNSLMLESGRGGIVYAVQNGSGSTTVNMSGSAGSGVGVICIDPGHGGGDCGAIRGGLTEKEVTLDICLRLRDILVSRGWKVLMTRETDRDVTWAGSSNTEELGARVRVGNEGAADVFVSVHCNAAANTAANGTSIHVYKYGDRVLANEMIYPLISATEGANRGVQQDRFFVLAHSKMPAVLVETAFISNPEEAELLASPQFRQRVAEALAEGLNSYAAKYIKQNQ
ncbi:MAG: N-acetylmuramoyl-L-alanine amidase family protein, partial [bacterium]|nr:N-acetylmuramoyl-L-alanine amidase family protein [bacterium]